MLVSRSLHINSPVPASHVHIVIFCLLFEALGSYTLGHFEHSYHLPRVESEKLKSAPICISITLKLIDQALHGEQCNVMGLEGTP